MPKVVTSRDLVWLAALVGLTAAYWSECKRRSSGRYAVTISSDGKTLTLRDTATSATLVMPSSALDPKDIRQRAKAGE